MFIAFSVYFPIMSPVTQATTLSSKKCLGLGMIIPVLGYRLTYWLVWKKSGAFFLDVSLHPNQKDYLLVILIDLYENCHYGWNDARTWITKLTRDKYIMSTTGSWIVPKYPVCNKRIQNVTTPPSNPSNNLSVKNP